MSHLWITHPAQLPPQLCYPRTEQKAKKSSIHVHCFLFKEKNQKRIRMKRTIRSRSISSKRRKKGRKRSIGRKSSWKWRVKHDGWSDLFDIVLQIMGHIKESFFKHEKKFRIKLQNSRQLMQAGNPLKRPWKNSGRLTLPLMDVAGVLCEGNRHLDGRVPALCVCCPAGVRCCQFCLSSA